MPKRTNRVAYRTPWVCIAVLLALSLESASVNAASSTRRVTTTNRRTRARLTPSSLIIAQKRGGDSPKPNTPLSLFKPLPGFTSQNLSGALTFLALDKFFSALFTRLQINFPAQLGGCLLLSLLMIVAPTRIGDPLLAALNPGADLLAKWIGVCFISGVVMLPAAPSIGGPLEVLKLGGIIVGGAIFTCFSTIAAVSLVRGDVNKAKVEVAVVPPPVAEVAASEEAETIVNLVETVVPPPPAVPPGGGTTPLPPASPFSQEFLRVCLYGALTTGLWILTEDKSYGFPASSERTMTAIHNAFLTLTTVSAFVFSIRLPKSFTKIVHPIFSSTAILWTVLALLSKYVYTQSFVESLSHYRTPGGLLLKLLGPTVISFALGIYSRRQVLRENLKVVATGVLVSSFGTLYGTAAVCRLLTFGGVVGGDDAKASPAAVLRLSTLARNVVAPLAVVICNVLGGNTSVQLGIVVVTGVLCSTFTRSILDYVGDRYYKPCKDPVIRGMGAGACGLSLGAAAMVEEEEAFPFAILAFIFNAVVATLIVTVPTLKDGLIKLAIGA